MSRRLDQLSELELHRRNTPCTLPAVFSAPSMDVHVVQERTHAAQDEASLQRLFPTTYGAPLIELSASNAPKTSRPLKIGCVLSGGQAAGGHNVIAGLYDYVKTRGAPGSCVYGFLNGPQGIFKGKYMELQDHNVDPYRNQGGFDMIGAGRHKIETPEQFADSLATAQKLGLDGIVIIGGDDSNTNAALLGEYFQSKSASTRVVGVPKTIDGDLKNEHIEMSFGFDSATKQYSELIGNIMSDCNSSKKYYHFVRLMGRSASHICLECALQTRPTLAWISEEVEKRNMTLAQITKETVDIICARHKDGKDFGVILLPEGLIEFVPEMSALIKELNELMSNQPEGAAVDQSALTAKLTPNSAELFKLLPTTIRNQLLLDRDPHGNVQVAKIETEELLMELCAAELENRRKLGQYSGKFMTLTHYFGYEGRCVLPSAVDSNYCYALGMTAGALVENGKNGYMSCVKGLNQPAEQWQPAGVPLTMMMNVERRKGADKPVIKKHLVELDAVLFQAFSRLRAGWATQDAFRNPGPCQFEGNNANEVTFTLKSNILSVDELVKVVQPELVDPLRVFEADPSAEKGEMEGGKIKLRDWLPHRCLAQYSGVQRERLQYETELPDVLRRGFQVVEGDQPGMLSLDPHLVRTVFPKLTRQSNRLVDVIEGAATQEKAASLRLGVCFSGRQTPGGHNVVSGVFDYLQAARPGSKLLGFLAGTQGLMEGCYVEITASLLDGFRNLGGFDMLGRAADKLNSEKQLAAAAATCQKLHLDGLVLVGGVFTMTDSTIISEYFLQHNVATRVIGVPGTVDGDIGGPFVETPFGFDTACKVFSQLIGNMEIDSASAKKYWYFLRLMGRAPSHSTLECGLQTHPNLILIGEEVEQRKQSLADLTRLIANLVEKRAQEGKNYGVIILPEGLLGRVPEVGLLIRELNALLTAEPNMAMEGVRSKLSPWSGALFDSLPEGIRHQLLIERESTGGIQHSQIHTEKLLAELVAKEMARRKALGAYAGPFSSICQFIGYQGRSAMPSNFDCQLAHTLGYVAGVLAGAGRTGVMASVRGLTAPVSQWQVGGVPLTSIVTVHHHPNDDRLIPTIDAPQVSLESRSFLNLRSMRSQWMMDDDYRNPGPIQFDGETKDRTSMTLEEEHGNMVLRLRMVGDLTKDIKNMCRIAYNDAAVDTALTGLTSLSHILQTLIRSKNPAAKLVRTPSGKITGN